MEEKTERFLKLLERQNAAIAAREKAKEPEVDPIRLQREQERRDKYGQPRAREKRRKRTSQVHNIFGYTDLT